MRRRRHRGSAPIQGINLTSLLDITFVLLIAFMVVAPALTHTMDVDLPEARPPSDAKPVVNDELVVVSVEYGGSGEGPHPLYANKEALASLDDLESRAVEWSSQERPVTLEIDWRVPYGTYIKTAASLQRSGITKYQLVYEEP